MRCLESLEHPAPDCTAPSGAAAIAKWCHTAWFRRLAISLRKPYSLQTLRFAAHDPLRPAAVSNSLNASQMRRRVFVTVLGSELPPMRSHFFDDWRRHYASSSPMSSSGEHSTGHIQTKIGHHIDHHGARTGVVDMPEVPRDKVINPLGPSAIATCNASRALLAGIAFDASSADANDSASAAIVTLGMEPSAITTEGGRTRFFRCRSVASRDEGWSSTTNGDTYTSYSKRRSFHHSAVTAWCPAMTRSRLGRAVR